MSSIKYDKSKPCPICGGSFNISKARVFTALVEGKSGENWRGSTLDRSGMGKRLAVRFHSDCLWNLLASQGVKID